jgi:hypothetical protein
MIVGRQEAKGQIVIGFGFDLARAIDPNAVAVKQDWGIEDDMTIFGWT